MGPPNIKTLPLAETHPRGQEGFGLLGYGALMGFVRERVTKIDRWPQFDEFKQGSGINHPKCGFDVVVA